MRALFEWTARNLARETARASRLLGRRQVVQPLSQERTPSGVRRALAAIARKDGPIVVGPWISEVGFELLYWIPFLRWAVKEYELDPQRIIVISRGNVQSWYRGIVGRYIDIFETIAPEDLRKLNDKRTRLTNLQKHTVCSEVDSEILARLGFAKSRSLLHPEIMYNLFNGYWSGLAGFSEFSDHTIFQRLEAPPHGVLEQLPSSFVALKFYSRPSFPRAENAAFVQRMTLQIAEEGPVVLLNTGVRVDEHEEFETPRHPNIITLGHWMRPDSNLLVQSAVIGRASRTYCTYGGFAYLPLLFGVPAMGFFSRDKHFMRIHGRAAYMLSHKMKSPLSIVDTNTVEMLLKGASGVQNVTKRSRKQIASA